MLATPEVLTFNLTAFGDKAMPGQATASVTVDPSMTPCFVQYPIRAITLDGGGQSPAVNATLRTRFTGNIIGFSSNSVTICNGTFLSYEAMSTVGTAVCTISGSPTASAEHVTPGDKLICTNKPTGQDTDRFRIVGGN